MIDRLMNPTKSIMIRRFLKREITINMMMS